VDSLVADPTALYFTTERGVYKVRP
jgi:hypothetical protein